jgi:hypothetical protein
MPLANLAFGSQAAAGMLAGLVQEAPDGPCRRLAAGLGNTLALLGADAQELVRALGDRSARGRRLTLRRYVSVRAFVRIARALTRDRPWHRCASRSGAPPSER